MDTTKVVENISGTLMQFANAIPSAIRSGANDTKTDPPEYLFELLNFFPLDKVDWNAGAYDQYLFDLQKTINDNYEKGNFQVAYFYSHFIFMSYVYYCVEMAYGLQPNRVKDVYYPINGYMRKNDKPDIEKYNSVYEFSKIPEKEIFKIFHAMGMSHQQICDLSNYIGTRDDFAHATGKGNISEDELENNLKSIKGNMVALHTVFVPIITSKYIELLLNKHSLAFAQLNKEFEEFIFDNTFSFADLELLCKIGISGIRNENEAFKKNYHCIKKVHCAFIEYCMDNYAIPESGGYEALKNEAYLYYRYHENAEEYIENELGISGYSCVKDGGEFPLYECPACEAEQLVYDSEKQEYHCFDCDITYAEGDISFCERCGMLLCKSEEIVCDSCIEEAMKE